MEKVTESKQFLESVGIDVSKLAMDVFLYNKKAHRQFANNSKGYAAMQKWIRSLVCTKQVIYCFEHIGLK